MTQNGEQTIRQREFLTQGELFKINSEKEGIVRENVFLFIYFGEVLSTVSFFLSSRK